MPGLVEELRGRLAEVIDLRNAAHLLEWDQQTMMPQRGAATRAEALATLERISHDMFVSNQTGSLLDAARATLNGANPDSDDARLVEVTTRRWEKARRVPTDLAADIVRAGSIGREAWVVARARDDYQMFAPHLERNLSLARQYVDCFDSYECAYDVLLDDYEPGMRTAEVARLFAELKSELVPLIAKLDDERGRIDDSCLHADVPISAQRELVAEVVRQMGFDPSGWRLDDTVHPFATSSGRDDVRITTRWDANYFPMALYGAMHECGHGLYEAGVAPALQRTPIGQTESLGLHESQSRLWENMVGRGRPFCQVLAPRIAQLFGRQLYGLDSTTYFRAVNKVAPTFIRVEADEVTYGMHIVLRFELEQEMIEGRLSIVDLPEAWNARFKEYLGLDVPDPANGVLQDVHWSSGLIGYFPTYALGNLIGGQLWQLANSELPDLDSQIAAGDLRGLREWLRENVHQYGSKFSAAELLERVVGGPIEVGPFIAYLKGKLSEVYELEL